MQSVRDEHVARNKYDAEHCGEGRDPVSVLYKMGVGKGRTTGMYDWIGMEMEGQRPGENAHGGLEGLTERRDRLGNVDFFDRDGKHVVKYRLVDDWESIPHANKWTLDMTTIPRGIYKKWDAGEWVLTEPEWRRIIKMYEDNFELEEHMERHCMYMKSDEQIEFRSRYGLYHGFKKITWRRGKAQHKYTINTADPESDPPLNTKDIIRH